MSYQIKHIKATAVVPDLVENLAKRFYFSIGSIGYTGILLVDEQDVPTQVAELPASLGSAATVTVGNLLTYAVASNPDLLGLAIVNADPTLEVTTNLAYLGTNFLHGIDNDADPVAQICFAKDDVAYQVNFFTNVDFKILFGLKAWNLDQVNIPLGTTMASSLLDEDGAYTFGKLAAIIASQAYYAIGPEIDLSYYNRSPSIYFATDSNDTLIYLEKLLN